MGEKRAVLPQDLYALSSLADPQFSPDTALAAAVVVSIDETTDDYVYQVRLMDVASGNFTIISFDGSKARSPRFSESGKYVAVIVGAKEDADKVYVFETTALMAKSEWNLNAQNLTDVSGKVLFSRERLGQELFWLPDDKGLLVVEVESTLPEVKEYRNVYFKTDGVGLVKKVYTRFWMVEAGGDATEVHAEDCEVGSVALSPNGRDIAFTKQQSPETGEWVADIYTIHMSFVDGIETSLEKRKLTESRGPIRALSYAPDGKSIAWLGHQSGDDYGTESLWVTDVATRASRSVLPDFNRPTGVIQKGDVSPLNATDKPQFSADGSHLYFAAQDGGPTHVYKVDLVDGRPWRLTGDDERCVSHFKVSQSGDILFVCSTSSQPEELFLLSSGGEKRLTALNDSFCETLRLTEAKRMEFQGADGWPIEGWLMLPAGDDEQGALPLILSIHGGPHGAFGCGFTFKNQMLCSSGFAVLYVNPRGSQAYGTNFAASVIGDWGGKDYIDIMNALDAVLEQGVADANRLGVTGYSYGGFMTTWIIGHTDRFRAAAPGGCVSNLISFQGTSDIGKHWGPKEHLASVHDGFEKLWAHSPLAYVKNVTTPTLLYHAEGDDRCPIGQSEEYFTALRDLDKEAVFVRYPGGSHSYASTGKPSLRVDTNHRINHWFQEKLGVETVDTYVKA